MEALADIGDQIEFVFEPNTIGVHIRRRIELYSVGETRDSIYRGFDGPLNITNPPPLLSCCSWFLLIFFTIKVLAICIQVRSDPS